MDAEPRRVKLSDAERALLVTWQGCSLEAVFCGGYFDACVRSGARSLVVTPEEVPTPTARISLADVTVPRVKEVPTRERPEGALPFVAAQLGTVEEIEILTTLVRHTAPTMGEAVALRGGVVIRPGPSWGHRVYAPSVVTATAEDVVADVGIRFWTRGGRQLLVFTDTIGFSVDVLLDEGLPEDLAGCVDVDPLGGRFTR
jgi:hypothetical protein